MRQIVIFFSLSYVNESGQSGQWHSHCSQCPAQPDIVSTTMSPFWILLELKVMEGVVTTGALGSVELQSNHHQHINTQLYTGHISFMHMCQNCVRQVPRVIWGMQDSHVPHGLCDTKTIFRLPFSDQKHSALAQIDANSAQFGCLHIKLATAIEYYNGSQQSAYICQGHLCRKIVTIKETPVTSSQQ